MMASRMVWMSRSKSPGALLARVVRGRSTSHAGHIGRRAAAIDALAEFVATRYWLIIVTVVARSDELAQQIQRIDAHAGDRRKEPPANETDSASAACAPSDNARLAGIMAQSARWLSRLSSTQTRRVESDRIERGRGWREYPCRPSPNGRWIWTPRFMSSIDTVAEMGGEMPDGIGRVALAGDEAVAGIQRQAQTRQARVQPNHRPSRSTCRVRARALRWCRAPPPGARPARRHRAATLIASVRPDAGLRHAGPKRHRIRAGVGRDFECARQKLHAPRSSRPGRR